MAFSWAIVSPISKDLLIPVFGKVPCSASLGPFLPTTPAYFGRFVPQVTHWGDNWSTMRLQFRALLVCIVITLATGLAIAKIAPLKPVAPVESNGVRYAAYGDGRDQYVEASDIATGKELWKVKVFHTHIKFWIEEDVQWIFIKELKVVDNLLFVRDGQARCYAVDVKTRRIRKALCTGVFTQQESSTQ